MGLYDQLLGVTQQGLNNLGQTAQLRAQQPTFADVFMDRFRQAGQDQLARQKTMSDMAMNEAYKNAQMQKMKDDALNAHLARQTQLLNTASGDLDSRNRAGYEQLFTANGLPVSMLPQTEYQIETKTYPASGGPAPSSPANTSIYGTGAIDDSIDYSPAVTVETKTPIENTGRGSRLQYLYDAMQNKSDIEEMKAQTKLQAKKDAENKIALNNRMYREGRITLQQWQDEDFNLRSKIDPRAVGLASQGIMAAPYLRGPSGQNPGEIMSLVPTPQPPQTNPVQEFNTAVEGIKVKKQGAIAPVLKAAGVPTPQQPGQPKTVATKATPLTPKGAQEVAKFTQAHDTAISKLDDLSQLIDRLKGSPGLERAIGLGGSMNRSDLMHTDKQAYEAWTELERLMQAGTLNELKDLKATGATLGQVSNQEGERLEKSFSSIKPFGSYQQAIRELDRIQREVMTSRRNINKGASGMVGSLGQAPLEFHEIGEQADDPEGNTWEYRGKSYTDRKNWRLVKKAGAR